MTQPTLRVFDILAEKQDCEGTLFLRVSRYNADIMDQGESDSVGPGQLECLSLKVFASKT